MKTEFLPGKWLDDAKASHRAGHFSKAVSAYQALAEAPDFPDWPLDFRVRVLDLLGAAYLQQKDFLLGEQCLAKALALMPALPATWSNRALALTQLGRFEEALSCYEQVCALVPKGADGYVQQADILQQMGRTADALGMYAKALVIRPDYPEAHFNRGVALQSLGRRLEAVMAYRQAIRLKPDYAEAHNNLGVMLQETHQPKAAVASFNRSLPFRSGQGAASTHSNRGLARQMLGDFEGAMDDFDAALAINPEHRDGIWNKALLLLLQGEYEKGWALHNATPLRRDRKASKTFKTPEWLGLEPLAGQTLLIQDEQGLGDMLQFGRYAVQAAAQGARVVLVVRQPLIRLMQTLPCEVQISDFSDPDPPHDLHCWLMALPLAFRTTVATIPNAPYLSADPQAAARWAARFPHSGQLRVGLVWAGNPRRSQFNVDFVDQRRSINLQMLTDILRVEGVEFYSLQKDADDGSIVAQLHESPWKNRITDWTNELDDFADTAALIENLDLVISVDTSVLHVAGAMGKPVWLLDRFDHCWRWFPNKTSSPWYPSLRIFRQQYLGDWTHPVSEAAVALKNLAESKSA